MSECVCECVSVCVCACACACVCEGRRGLGEVVAVVVLVVVVAVVVVVVVSVVVVVVAPPKCEGLPSSMSIAPSGISGRSAPFCARCDSLLPSMRLMSRRRHWSAARPTRACVGSYLRVSE